MADHLLPSARNAWFDHVFQVAGIWVEWLVSALVKDAVARREDHGDAHEGSPGLEKWRTSQVTGFFLVATGRKLGDECRGRMSDVLERLKRGVQQFRAEVYGKRAEAYRKAASEPQRPHTLIVACADSRVDVEMLTSAGPGELFVMRNIGNMVPAYGEMLGGVSAVIEYAVNALGVQHALVCGHSDCGAMKALLDPRLTDGMPTVKSWLSNGRAALSVAETLSQKGGRELLTVLTEQNVLMQLAHLKTHPSVAGALARGQLTVSGWIYEIGSGEVRIAQDGDRDFVVWPEAGADLGTGR